MTTIPESTWEEARALRNAVNWNSNSSVEHIAHALHRARQEATEKAVNVVKSQHDLLKDNPLVEFEVLLALAVAEDGIREASHA